MKSLQNILLLLFCSIQLADGGELQEAAARGDMAKIRILLKANPASLNAREGGTTALHEATRAGHLEVVKLLVTSGANVNATDFSRLTPLKLALGRRQLGIVDFLRKNGGLEQAPVTTPVPTSSKTGTQASNGLPPLRIATPSSSQPTQRPAPAPAPSSRGVAPTPAPVQHPAASAGPEMTPVIFPIHEAARIGDVEQIKFNYKNAPDLVDATDQKGLTPLHVAAANRQFVVAETLIGLRAKIDARSSLGQTPLHVAVRQGDVRIAALLLTNRAGVDIPDKFRNTPLLLGLQSTDAEALDSGGGLGSRTPTAGGGVAMSSLKLQQLQLATLLVHYRANVNARNQAGATPLGLAVRLGNEPVVNLLLGSGANPNVVETATGKTPLHLAAGRGQLAIVQALLRAGATVDATDRRGDTPLGHALREGHTNTISALRAARGTIGTLRPLNTSEQSLVSFYQQTEAALQRGSHSDKAKIVIGLNPTKAECERMFPKHGAAAWKVVEEINRQVRQAFAKPVRDAEQGRAIWRVLPEAPGLVVQEWRSRGWLAGPLPVYSLAVDKMGGTSRPGDYCFVNGRWVMVPPLRNIAAQFAAADSPKR